MNVFFMKSRLFGWDCFKWIKISQYFQQNLFLSFSLLFQIKITFEWVLPRFFILISYCYYLDNFSYLHLIVQLFNFILWYLFASIGFILGCCCSISLDASCVCFSCCFCRARGQFVYACHATSDVMRDIATHMQMTVAFACHRCNTFCCCCGEKKSRIQLGAWCIFMDFFRCCWFAMFQFCVFNALILGVCPDFPSPLSSS